MRNIFIILIAVVIGSPGVCSSVTTPALDVISDAVHRQVQHLADSVQSFLPAGTPVRVQIARHPDSLWLESVILSVLSEKGLSFSSNANVAVSFVIRRFGMIYAPLEPADSVQREFSVQMQAIVSTPQTTQLFTVSEWSVRDTCSRYNAKLAESPVLSVTQAEFPIQEKTVWEEVLQPVIFVAAAVTTVVLLFTVRSN
ncbi:MAG: hypothetical protein D8M52_04600 [Chlorobi bacterium]|nr:MAG: hypothetical protein F9K28_03730 [Bacteroidota bacterium]KXK34681.1 MAG: hypothetical protein UZ06_CHB003001145 [Chlorobi bacterium OLB6]MBL1160983.1 hypothetical protein [Chlorobiota bacterium]MBW7852941.1 hypothetical protein [Candidatus Kapabacteria bacterium]MCC6330807.1 hypothetical protein [Ignavibacteria bacterium]